MDIIITNNSDYPIYAQIKDQIKTMILNGELKEGDALPSMRLLSKELRISIITTKRAYEELEREGYIESYTGKGSFVKGINREMVKETVVYEIETLFDEILEKADMAGLSYDELEQLMHTLYEERCKDEKNL
ncbi:MAG: GntR family transcriptional regulator [Lachnospiraceae bacterium]|nr:GntR family transcriptional regulator [Lachnospiraceae bacterium]